jgi:hypothetical protein
MKLIHIYSYILLICLINLSYETVLYTKTCKDIIYDLEERGLTIHRKVEVEVKKPTLFDRMFPDKEFRKSPMLYYRQRTADKSYEGVYKIEITIQGSIPIIKWDFVEKGQEKHIKDTGETKQWPTAWDFMTHFALKIEVPDILQYDFDLGIYHPMATEWRSDERVINLVHQVYITEINTQFHVKSSDVEEGGKAKDIPVLQECYSSVTVQHEGVEFTVYVIEHKQLGGLSIMPISDGEDQNEVVVNLYYNTPRVYNYKIKGNLLKEFKQFVRMLKEKLHLPDEPAMLIENKNRKAEEKVRKKNKLKRA